VSHKPAVRAYGYGSGLYMGDSVVSSRQRLNLNDFDAHLNPIRKATYG